METLGNDLCQKLCPRFVCEKCDYKTSKKSSFDNHNLSAKHKKSIIGNQMETLETNYAQIMPELCPPNLICINCDKSFKNRSGLWKHKKICNNKKGISTNEPPVKTESVIDKELIMMLIKDNSDIKEMILELVKNGTINTTNNNANSHNTTNSHNKAFNLNFFLNETCKNAMNISDFLETIKIQLSDLERFGEVGYAEGLSKIITSNLNALDVTQRPIHCTDKKRETMYVKDNNVWEKEDDHNTKLRKFIKNVSYKNIRLLPQFREKNPEYKNSSSIVSGKYDKMVLEAMGGVGNDDLEKETKIIHNISKCVIVDK